jgi:hypothetical protein
MQDPNGTLFGLNATVALWIAGFVTFSLISLAVYDSFRQSRRRARFKAHSGHNVSGGGFLFNTIKNFRSLRESLTEDSNRRRQRDQAREREREQSK